MIVPASRVSSWHEGIEPAERLARLHSDADARCSGFSGLFYSRTATQSGRNGGRGSVDSCSSIIPIITTLLAIRVEFSLVIVRKSRVDPLIEHHHRFIVVGREIAACRKVCALSAATLNKSPRRTRPTKENLEQPQKVHGVHQLKLRERGN